MSGFPAGVVAHDEACRHPGHENREGEHEADDEQAASAFQQAFQFKCKETHNITSFREERARERGLRDVRPPVWSRGFLRARRDSAGWRCRQARF